MLADRVNDCDVIVLDLGLVAGFAKEAGSGVRVRRELRQHQLDGDLAPQSQVEGPVHDPHASTAELAIEHVPLLKQSLVRKGCRSLF